MYGNFVSIGSLSEAVLLLTNRNDVDQALRTIHAFVERIVTEPLCTSQVFGSKTLDDLCQIIGKANLPQIFREKDAKQREHGWPVITYIVTKLQKSGGHTRVIEDFIKAEPGARHVILSTEIHGASDADYLTSVLAKQGNVVFEQAPKGNYQQRLSWLQERLLEIHSKKVYLFNHHQDSVAVAAIQPEMKLDAWFYHHGDHHLCLGVYLPHLGHIDPHPMGYHNCRDVLGIDNAYVPLTVEDQGKRPIEWPFFQDGYLTTCTAARSNKVEIPYFISYLDLVPSLLHATGGKHIHIGRLTPWALLKIRWRLKRRGIKPERFVYVPWVPSVWKALHSYRVDLYVASFPYGGGLTSIEAMGAGISVALHRHIFSRMLSGIDLAYPGAFSWRFPDDLIKYCTSLTASDLERASCLARQQYETFHSTLDIGNGVRECPKLTDLPDKFTVQNDEWALWMERQLSIRRILARAASRAARRLRAWW